MNKIRNGSTRIGHHSGSSCTPTCDRDAFTNI